MTCCPICNNKMQKKVEYMTPSGEKSSELHYCVECDDIYTLDQYFSEGELIDRIWRGVGEPADNPAIQYFAEAFNGDEEKQQEIAKACKLPVAYLFAPETLGKDIQKEKMTFDEKIKDLAFTTGCGGSFSGGQDKTFQEQYDLLKKAVESGDSVIPDDVEVWSVLGEIDAECLLDIIDADIRAFTKKFQKVAKWTKQKLLEE